MNYDFIVPWKGERALNCPYNAALAAINWCVVTGKQQIKLPFYINENDTSMLFSLYGPPISIVRNDNETTNIYHIPSIHNECDESELTLLRLTYEWHIASFSREQKYKEWTIMEDFLIEPLQELGYPIKDGKLIYESIGGI